MPFVAECIYCKHRVLAPDGAAGVSVKCPKCESFFMLSPSGHPVPEKAAVASPKSAALPAVAPGPAAPRVEYEPSSALPPAAPEDPRPSWRRPDPVGVVALLLAGLALGCTTFASAGWLVLPLAGLAVPVGLGGLALAALERPRTWRVSAPAGAALGAAVVAVAWLAPWLLGPAFEASRARDPIDPTAVRAVPLPGVPLAEVPAAAEWADAGRFALQQGRVRVSVASALLGPPEVPPRPGAKRPAGPPPEKYLLVRVRAEQAGTGKDLRSGKFGEPGSARPKATLTDASGKPLAARNVDPAAAGEDRASGVFPVAVSDELFAFERPADGAALRLEVSGAWGGPFRFSLPAGMLRPEPPPAGPPGRVP